MKHPFKLGVEHLPFPNGGGLKAMSTAPKSQNLEMKALKAKHELELARLQEKHTKVNQTKVQAPKKAIRRNQGR